MCSKLLLIFFFGTTAAVEYHLEILTSTKADAGTDGKISAELLGSKGDLSFGILDNPGNDFVRSQWDKYTTNPAGSIGDIKCVVLTADTRDAWLPDKLVAWSDDDSDKSYFYNTDSWMSSDYREGISSLKLCKQGSKTYEITLTTSTDAWAGSDWIYPSVTITGTKGSTTTGILDRRDYDDYVRGRTDNYVFEGMKDVKRIKCVEVKVRGTDAWLLTTVQVTEVGNTKNAKSVTFYNRNKEWLSTNSSKGNSSLKLCA